jgi:hypothetical protein
VENTKQKIEWTITLEGKDYNGKPIIMVRRNGEAWSRAFSLSEARHMVRRYEREAA